jgi:hypothetical protein
MARAERRQVSREIKNIAKKAKEAMYDWIYQLHHEPTEKELQAWQAGYIAGLNAKND